jgi:hypothetical protein
MGSMVRTPQKTMGTDARVQQRKTNGLEDKLG